MPRGRPALNSQPVSQSQPELREVPSLEERQQLAYRIEETAVLLCEMLECLKRHGGRQELLARAEESFEFGVLAAMWSLDYISAAGNLVMFDRKGKKI